MFCELNETVEDDMYADNLVTGGESASEVYKIKGDSVKLFQRGGFKLHKWHSVLETNDLVNENELNFAKQQLGTKPKETKILGLLWDKREDSFIIQVLNINKNATKRNILSTLASICDPLGFVSPCLLLGKIIYHKLCDLKVSWDKEITIDIQIQRLKWITGLKTEIKIRRSIPNKNEPITEIYIHLFSDASIDGVCTVAYAVVYQPNKLSQSLITSKSRLAEENISIPRLELIPYRKKKLVKNDEFFCRLFF